MSQLKESKNTQWWTAKIIKNKKNKMDYNGFLTIGKPAYATVLESGVVLVWQQRLVCTFKSINAAKEFATCITKCENKADTVIRAWNNAMF